MKDRVKEIQEKIPERKERNHSRARVVAHGRDLAYHA
jgi:hypothetical protein